MKVFAIILVILMITATPYATSAHGGEGFPFFTPRMTTQNIMDQVLADHITANSPVAPAVQGWINCIKVSNPASTNNCPVVTPLAKWSEMGGQEQESTLVPQLTVSFEAAKVQRR